jgi:hypothetical protein
VLFHHIEALLVAKLIGKGGQITHNMNMKIFSTLCTTYFNSYSGNVEVYPITCHKEENAQMKEDPPGKLLLKGNVIEVSASAPPSAPC